MLPFRLDDDSDHAPSEVIVPAFPPGALESWLESPDSDLELTEPAPPPDDFPREASES